MSGLIRRIVRYGVDRTKEFGQASLRRTGELADRLNDIQKGTNGSGLYMYW